MIDTYDHRGISLTTSIGGKDYSIASAAALGQSEPSLAQVELSTENNDGKSVLITWNPRDPELCDKVEVMVGLEGYTQPLSYSPEDKNMTSFFEGFAAYTDGISPTPTTDNDPS